MSLFCIILDRPLAFGDGHFEVSRLPYGASTLLEQLARLADTLGCERTFLAKGGRESDGSALDRSLSDVLDVACVESSAEAIGQMEPTDFVVFFDPLHWLGQQSVLRSIVHSATGSLRATHIISGGANDERPVERVEHDAEDRPCRVRRLFSPKCWIQGELTAVCCSVVPAALLTRARVESLSELRMLLAARGVVTHDRMVCARGFDLRSTEGLLGLCETSVINAVRNPNLPEDYSRLGGQVLVGRGSLIHSSVRITGPTIIQPGSLLEENASIVGPALIGVGSRICRDTVIARSLVLPGGTVSPRSVVYRDIVGCTRDVVEVDSSGASLAARSVPTVEGDEPAPTETVFDPIPERRGYLACKRVVDATLSAIGLAILSPVLLIIALLIKLDSRGPILFSHRREGRGGHEFPCFKFRTMCRNAHVLQRSMYADNEIDGPQFKLRHDPRVTRLGSFLRRTNLDELPQLINVLLGHVSLVGPRPSPFRENQICIPWRRARLSVRPGITGLWQLCRAAERTSGDFQEWVFYDMTYVRNMSAWLDFKILMATVLSAGGQWHIPMERLVPTHHDLQYEWDLTNSSVGTLKYDRLGDEDRCDDGVRAEQGDYDAPEKQSPALQP